ncbi:NADP-dependent 3-hydroxy acid dehydrogenase YdfG [Rhodovulum bhavnagarense]|uniref:NADP-dependent 3-hydroxy acid dehydrogenase YdfG n=1 Tax=Rhodovulum bhavnagarense TaxID=992286 RepID=A0A4R2RGI1_9RHOB|nr:SDR family NAD(P)-dependent oxidoreductase [Rhodovulum bhavnagarense]TCP61678.1 NADP-dependent 3-hydroxy acid dehydrogenase YdfG [Rhodovulum bhavnagarense]
MTELIGKRYWIVGASEGLGRAVAERLAAMGARLVLSARTPERLEELAASLPRKADVVPMDVSDRASVEAAFEAVGEIDGMVFLAGVYWPMTAQAWDADKVEQMCDVNLLGAARVLGHVVPRFVERDAGHIVITGSLAGFRGLPGAVGYCASKAGVMSLAESLHADLRGTGVKVQLVNPGFVRTRLTDKNDFAMPFIKEPDAAAREIVEHMMSDGFARSFPLVFSWLFRLGQFLPEEIYFPLFASRR